MGCPTRSWRFTAGLDWSNVATACNAASRPSRSASADDDRSPLPAQDPLVGDALSRRPCLLHPGGDCHRAQRHVCAADGPLLELLVTVAQLAMPVGIAGCHRRDGSLWNTGGGLVFLFALARIFFKGGRMRGCRCGGYRVSSGRGVVSLRSGGEGGRRTRRALIVLLHPLLPLRSRSG